MKVEYTPATGLLPDALPWTNLADMEMEDAEPAVNKPVCVPLER